MAKQVKSTLPIDTAAIAFRPVEGRVAKRRRATRARMLEAAYAVIAEVGVDGAKIKDITDRADIGFGTFYSFFETKDELANQLLDCVIDDLGRRNVIATKELRHQDPALVIPVSMLLVMREAARTPMWQWWALRPDLLVDRMRDGFGPFGKSDIQYAIDQGIFHIAPEDVDSAWALANWMMVGGIHDIVVGQRPPDTDIFVVKAIVRMMGGSRELAQRISAEALPKYSAPDIEWAFELADQRRT